ncbi:MAG: hypothetical protein AAF576_05035 [Pseudomonadota bacterium]
MKTTRRTALFLMGSSALSACTTGPQFVTRSDSDPFEGGIGGTGIVGTLNGFGSLLVNGLTIELPDTMRVRTPYGRVGVDGLATGQVLTMVANRSASGYAARDVVIDYALVGRLDQSGGQPSVNGVPLLAAGAALAGHDLRGTRVAVSGVWAPGGVRPSLIEPAPDARDLIAGTVLRTGDGAAQIGNVELRASGTLPEAGSYAIALGQADQGGFDATEVREGRFTELSSIEQLSVDGYLEPSASQPGFRIAGLGHNFARDIRLGAVGAQRALYFGRYDGLFGAQRGYLVPDAFTERQALLASGLEDGFEGQILRL